MRFLSLKNPPVGPPFGCVASHTMWLQLPPLRIGAHRGADEAGRRRDLRSGGLQLLPQSPGRSDRPGGQVGDAPRMLYFPASKAGGRWLRSSRPNRGITQLKQRNVLLCLSNSFEREARDCNEIHIGSGRRGTILG